MEREKDINFLDELKNERFKILHADIMQPWEKERLKEIEQEIKKLEMS